MNLEKRIFIDLGLREYKETWELQRILHQKRCEGKIQDTLIFVEHLPVFTLGRKGKRENLLVSDDFLQKKNISFYEIERGGDITFHGPGQLVGYLIFHIKENIKGIKPFVENIEDAIILSLKDFNIKAEKKEKYTGVWVGEEKICAIGIAVKKWVSFHGFALNVNTDLSYFNYIIPCGIQDKGVSSIKKIMGREIDMKHIKEQVKKSFEIVFKYKFEKIDFAFLKHYNLNCESANNTLL